MNGSSAPADRQLGLRLAHVHLRTGALALARAELETAAGAGTLDLRGLLDLAEVRWRTGDLAGAGEAAGAYLASSEGEDDALACVIGAEAAAAFGRPDESKRLSIRAIELASIPLDAVFAGVPARAAWPAEMLELHMPAHAAVALALDEGEAVAPDSLDRPGLWDGDRHVPAPAAPDPDAHVSAGRMALAAGDHAAAALHLGLALRLGPSVAPAVLDAVGDAVSPALALVRGDALRLVGQEWEARRAFVAAAAGVHAATTATPTTEATPTTTASFTPPPPPETAAAAAADEPPAPRVEADPDVPPV